MIEINNQARLVTVKPETRLIEIGCELYEVGYHYMRRIGHMKKESRKVIWY